MGSGEVLKDSSTSLFLYSFMSALTPKNIRMAGCEKKFFEFDFLQRSDSNPAPNSN